jgi:hypothetical protein
MAFRKVALEAIGGFDPQFRVAGDDVDICWRLRERGWKLGFSPAAVVWHHRRNSLRAFWAQQRGYGRAEALLERKWPQKYNSAGHLAWAGRIYASYLTQAFGVRAGRIYYGSWGSALFQSLYEPAPSSLRALLMTPEWYLLLVALAILCAVSTLWRPLVVAVPLLCVAIGAQLVHAGMSAAAASFPSASRSRTSRLARYGLTALLHLLQPLARLYGRMGAGLTPWRNSGRGLVLPVPRMATAWTEQWRALDARLSAFEAALHLQCALTRRGGEYDRWDLEVRGGMFGAVRTLMTVEEHGQGRQLVRVRVWPKCSDLALIPALVLAALVGDATLDGSWLVSAIFGAMVGLIALRTTYECASSMCAAVRALDAIGMGGVRSDDR